MKRIIMILMTAAAMTTMSCGDGRTARERDNDEMDNTELAEPDSTVNDTTSTNDMNQRDDGTMERDETQDNIRTERDSIQ